ncbi:MAG TPA: arginine decarboxylase, pyruvoyl-dependent [Methanomicrobia archaeon]|nr:arginine decarboxylase, pyruvoyl-dependent [Methanomicrobia archaeon]
MTASCCMLTPHSYVLLSTDADSDTPLNAFDEALRASGVANFNFIGVSSILPRYCRQAPLREVRNIQEGSFMYCVMSRIESDTPGATISSAIACATTTSTVGCVAEFKGHCSGTEAEREAIRRARAMVASRDAEVESIETTSATHVVTQCGCSVSLCLLLY